MKDFIGKTCTLKFIPTQTALNVVETSQIIILLLEVEKNIQISKSFEILGIDVCGPITKS